MKMPKTEISGKLGRTAVLSLLIEVSSSPKPGLVDRFNCGAHRDMDFFTFMESSAALSGYFIKCALLGAEFQGDHPKELFSSLRPAGIAAERTMFQATGGVNTHKGLVFSLGILCAAAAHLMAVLETELLDADELCGLIASMTEGLSRRELASMNKSAGLSNGERLYRKYGLKGIRGEVERGFPTVRNGSLPVFRQLKAANTHHMNDICVQTLLHLMAVNEDTNVVARQDLDTLEYVRQYARRALEAGGVLTEAGKSMVLLMDKDFIARNISPGGSADLLAVTVMLDRICL